MTKTLTALLLVAFSLTAHAAPIDSFTVSKYTATPELSYRGNKMVNAHIVFKSEGKVYYMLARCEEPEGIAKHYTIYAANTALLMRNVTPDLSKILQEGDSGYSEDLTSIYGLMTKACRDLHPRFN